MIARSTLIAGSVLMFAVWAPFADATERAVAPINGSCVKEVNIDFASPEGVVKTTSQAFVDVPGTLVTFTQGGAVKGCAIVTFSAVTDAPNPGGIQVRVLLDGTAVALPGQVSWTINDSESFAVRSFEFIFPNVAPGVHTANVQWAAFGAGTITFAQRTLIVIHR